MVRKGSFLLRSAIFSAILLSSDYCHGVFALEDSPAAKDHGNLENQQQQQPIILPQEVKRVAIIGAGAAGASAAYYLEEFASQKNLKVGITVFERNHYVGGRSTTVHAYGNASEPVELGASIFVKVNSILHEAVQKFGLNTSAFDTDGTVSGEALGIWDGNEFVFTLRAHSNWWDTAKTLWRYGMSPIRTERLMKQTVGQFLKMYSTPIFPWKSLQETVNYLGLTPATSSSGLKFLEMNSIYPPFSTHVIQASTRVNYASNLGHIHGVETLVCMSTDNAVGVIGGNWQMFSKMIEASGAKLRLNTTVKAIDRSDDGGSWTVKYTHAGHDEDSIASSSGSYDAVIIAGPHQFSGIKESSSFRTPEEIEYVRLHVTLFTSPLLLSPKYFNYAKEKIPDMILTTLPEDADPKTKDVGKTRFWSVNILRKTVRVLPDGTSKEEYLYKVFSPVEWTDEMIVEMMGLTGKDLEEKGKDVLSWTYRHIWHSYPVEKPRSTFDDHLLGKSIYHTGNMEAFISTMETNALSGKNAAANLVQEWTGPDDLYKEEL